MATITATQAVFDNNPGLLVTWTPLANGDTGNAMQTGAWRDASVQVQGTFGTGGSVTFQGSNDGTNWFALTDPQGNAITKTADALEQISEISRYVRPNVTAGDGTTALTVIVFAGRS